ncbi:MAG: crossover junction endodeoxyribonuclease RuvC [Clostridia bacterium]|jgi:crossover junction endodeoxyribonuclease RuvC|nr:crossover junction endodeoxyribonuclease RuvC [Clostridia bacterium]
MIILGIDPGTAITGFGLISMSGNKFNVIDYGAIRTHSNLSLPKRLDIIFTRVDELVRLHKPQFMAVEELFFNKNVTTALSVGHARGVIMLAAVRHDVEIFQYTPLQVKQSVVGYGKADKKQVQYMVTKILNLAKAPTPDDASDALAIAICQGHSTKLNRMLSKLEEC